MTRSLTLTLTLCSVLATSAPAQVYQYAAAAKDAGGKEITAYLWVPPDADRLRAALIGGQTLMEAAFAADPAIRRACADEQLAIVYFSPPVDAVFDYKGKNSAALLQKALDDLAEVSGYRELAVAPLFPFGHSVSSIFASHVVCWNPDRCFGALPFKGGLMIPSSDSHASIAGVPILVIKGQFEEFGPGPSGVLRDFEDRETAWKGMRKSLLRLRQKDAHNLIAYLVEPGGSHFAWSQRLAPYAAEFIQQAARKRIPDWPVDTRQPVKCRAIDPSTGALTSVRLGKDASATAAADFQGDRGQAFWHLNLALAKMADALHKDLYGKRAQFVTFADPNSGKPIYVGHDLRLRLRVNWIGPDTFRVAGTFLDKAPDKYPQVDGPVGHAGRPVRFRIFNGPAEQTGADTFRICPSGRGRMRVNILAFHPGDATYRYAEQQGRLDLPDRLTKGRSQTITFSAVGPLKPDDPPVTLRATSDAKLAVRYYVASGPAVVEGDRLKLAELPKRARFPMQVVVVAYQYGSAVEPFVQSAEPVERVVLVRP